MAQFQTVSNPLRTQAGGSGAFEFPMNIATFGNQVNISTGVTSAMVDNTIFSDGQLAVYQVDQVLLPMSIFGTKAPAPAPAPEKPKKKKAPAAAAAAEGPAADSAPVDASTAVKSGTHYLAVILGAIMIGKYYLWKVEMETTLEILLSMLCGLDRVGVFLIRGWVELKLEKRVWNLNFHFFSSKFSAHFSKL